MKGDRYLLTGATGFLGKVMKAVLSDQHTVTTLGRSPENDYVTDLSKQTPVFDSVFDVVVHNAGKAHMVPKHDEEKRAFIEVNVKGTERLLFALASATQLPRAFVFISSVSVYGLLYGEHIDETHPLNATDPYGQSKIAAEALLSAWCREHGVALTILRLPLVVGKDAPGNLGAMVRGLRKGYYLSIGGGLAKKSMVLAEDVVRIIPEAEKHPGIYNLTDGCHPSFHEIETAIAKKLGVKVPMRLPLAVARLIGLGGDLLDMVLPGKAPVTSGTIRKITSTLTFDDQAARDRFGWNPRPVLQHLEY